MTDILFINPGHGQNYLGVDVVAPAIAPPTWILLLAEYCRRHGGHEAAIYDANVQGWGDRSILRKHGGEHTLYDFELRADRRRIEIPKALRGTGQILAAYSPRLIVIWVAGHNPSASTQTMPIAGKIARNIKAYAPDIPIAMGGVHPSALPERTLAEEAIDYVIVGEGFRTITRLAWYLRGRPMLEIAGLKYRGQESFIPAPLVDPDKNFSGYAWDLLEGGLGSYRAHDWHLWQDAHKSQDYGATDIRSPYATIYTQLGCPMHCIAKETTIITAQGRNKKVQNLKVGNKLMAWDEANKYFAETTIIACGNRKVEKILKIRMENGSILKITSEHPVLTPGGWEEVGKLKPGDLILLMGKTDKKSYLNSKYAPTRRPEIKAMLSKKWKENGHRPPNTAESQSKRLITMREKGGNKRLSEIMKHRWKEGTAPKISLNGCQRISERMKNKNPMFQEEVQRRVSNKMKEQYSEISSNRMKRLHMEGHIRHGKLSEKARRFLSDRMSKNNPMHNPGIAKRVGETIKNLIASGKHITFMQTDEGRKIITEKARERALSENNPFRRENDPFWGNGIERKYPSEYTERLRKQIKDRDGNICQNCGSMENLVCHHIDNDKFNCDPCNLICLCQACNSKATFDREGWEIFYQDLMASRNQCPHYEQIEKIEELQGDFTVYNFQCSPHDNYFAEFIAVHNCDFCVTPGFFGSSKVRAWAPETVAGWIGGLVSGYGVRNIRIEDEIFLLDFRRVEAICDLLIEQGHDLNLFCYGWVREHPEGLLRKMKAAGFNWISLGIESARGKTSSNPIACVRAIQQAGISVAGNYIFGLPGERQQDMEATLQLALDLRCEMSNFYCCMPLPGSTLYAQAEREGKLPPSWEGYSQLGYTCHPMGTEYLTPAEVLSFRDQAYQTFHRDPAYLDMMRDKFGDKVIEYIKTGAKKDIPRLLLSTTA